jgi:SAM-dependent methyltransferase
MNNRGARAWVATACRISKRARLAAEVHGFIGMLRHYGRKVTHDIEATLFDALHGVDTGGTIWVRDLEIDSPNGIHGFRYQGTPLSVVRRMIRELRIEQRRFTFIDLGSGKGRVILIAAESAFNRVIGVEFSRELAAIARENIRIYLSKHPQRYREVELVYMDAAVYEFDDQPTVLFLYNPFGQFLIERVLANIERSLELAPRDFWIVYYNPLFGDVLAKSNYFNLVRSVARFQIYRSV